MHTKTQHEVLGSEAPQCLGRQSCFRIFLAGCIFSALYASQIAAQAHAAWTWIDGNNAINRPGNYGVLGTASPTNLPPARWNAATWTDKDGNLWLFGGSGYDPATDSVGTMTNDLWKFSPSLKQWAWMGGNKIAEIRSRGIYGERGTPGKGNTPGARNGAVSWTDPDGNFWLLGGTGYDAMGHSGGLNDLWEYDPSTHEWAWMSGSASVGPNDGRPGVYGMMGVPDHGNVPGDRFEAAGWLDQAGNLWLFGGTGSDADANAGTLDDLWEYQPALNEWAWMGGSNKVPKSGGWPGKYGEIGRQSPTYRPGSRYGASAWTDGSGNLWLFGGSGFDRNGNPVNLNDLWEFSVAKKGWAWLGGSDTPLECSKMNSPILTCKGEPGVYGKLGQAAQENIPGRRTEASAWKDETGNFWLFGGAGYDSAGNGGRLDDLWKLNPDTHEWTWLGGNDIESGCGPIPAGVTFCFGQPGEYGTSGKPAPANHPGARTQAAAWVDKQGNLWLFGGYGMGSTDIGMGALNDLWEYRQAPAANAPSEKPRSLPSPSRPPKP